MGDNGHDSIGLTRKVYRRGLRWQRQLMRRLPPEFASRLDQLRPKFAVSWGGPLNGQQGRRDLVRQIAKSMHFDRVIETGTHLGTSAAFFADVFGSPVHTVESEPRFFLYSQRRFKDRADIHVSQGDSREFLRTMRQAADETVFFYLDAHWEEDLPLAEELRIIAADWTSAVVMIDDFEVPHDPGYAFDDYGPGRRLCVDYLPADALIGWSIFYPTVPSEVETGARRGCCVLVSPALADAVDLGQAVTVIG